MDLQCHNPAYRSYKSMLERCHNPRSKAYRHYGKKGIKVCTRWKDSFKSFLEDMGQRPDGMTLDRIDNEKGYEPGNCRWSDWDQQANNRCTTIPDGLRAAVFKLRKEGYSYEVIARILYISRGSAHVIIKESGCDPLVNRTPPPSWLDMKRVYRTKARPDQRIKPHKRREVVRLRTLGHSQKKIAQTLGISPSSVKYVLQRLEKDPIIRPVFKGNVNDLLSQRIDPAGYSLPQ